MEHRVQTTQTMDRSSNYTVDIRDDLHVTDRYDEDGERVVRSTFYLVATDAAGRRWSSPHVHLDLASARSERRHLRRRGADLDPVRSGWYETEPMYGSAAWTPEAEADLDRAERSADGWTTPRW